MPGHRDQRPSQERPDPTQQRRAWGSDPATARPPDRTLRPPPPTWPAPPAPRGRNRRRTRRRVRPLNLLLFRPLRGIVFAYARALLRAVIPWLLPLGILAALALIGIYLSAH
jgi:hypothetical protein